MESMLLKKPVICLDGSGMRIITNDKCAIRIPMDTEEKILANMINAVIKLYNDNDLVVSMGNESKKRIEEHYKWEYISTFILEVLDDLDKNNVV